MSPVYRADEAAYLRNQRLTRRRELQRRLETAVVDLNSAYLTYGLYASDVSEMVEFEVGIGPGDEDQERCLADPEYSAVLAFGGRLGDALRGLQQLLDDFRAQQCPTCRAGEDVRQQANGDLLCLRCGHVLAAPAEAQDAG